MSRMTALLLALRLTMTLAVLPSLIFGVVIYAATWLGGYPSADFALVAGGLVFLPCTGLAAEEWWKQVEAAGRNLMPSLPVDLADFWTCDHGHPFCEDHTHSIDYHSADCWCGRTEARCPWEEGSLPSRFGVGTEIECKVKAEDLAAHRRNVHRDGGTIVRSCPVGDSSHDRYLVTAHYPDNRFN